MLKSDLEYIENGSKALLSKIDKITEFLFKDKPYKTAYLKNYDSVEDLLTHFIHLFASHIEDSKTIRNKQLLAEMLEDLGEAFSELKGLKQDIKEAASNLEKENDLDIERF